MGSHISLKEALRRVREAKTLADIEALFRAAFGDGCIDNEKIGNLKAVKHGLSIPLAQAAKLANPKWTHGSRYEGNCQRCTPTFELLRRGYMGTAAPNTLPHANGTSKHPFMNGSECFKDAKICGYHYDRNEPIGRETLLKELNLLPNGARVGIFWIDVGAKNGHSIVCEKVNGQLIFVDPQSGIIGRQVLRAATKENGYYWYRMDNLEINEDFEWDEIVQPQS